MTHRAVHVWTSGCARAPPRSLCLMCGPYHVCAAAPRVGGECSSLSAWCPSRWKFDVTVTCGPLLFTGSGSMTRCGGHRLRARSAPVLLSATFVLAGAADGVRCCGAWRVCGAELRQADLVLDCTHSCPTPIAAAACGANLVGTVTILQEAAAPSQAVSKAAHVHVQSVEVVTLLKASWLKLQLLHRL